MAVSVVEAMVASISRETTRQPIRVGQDDFELLKVIGQGGFGKVDLLGDVSFCDFWPGVSS